MLSDKFVTVDGLRARYIEDGDGPAVLLMHGGATGSSADVWQGTVPQLARDGRRVIAYDHPGYGLTDNPSDHSVGYRRQFILKLMDALELDRAALLAHSGSGGPSVEIALANPERLSALLVLGTGSLLPALPGESGPPPAGDVPPKQEPTVDDVREVLEEQLYHHELITPELLELRLKVAGGKNYQAALARRSLGRGSAGVSKPLWQRLDEVSVPFMLIYGADDRPDTRQRVEHARELYPRLQYHLIEHCKHLIQLDAADEFVALASGFLPSRARQSAPAR
jgi:pimeloyl-ACP methyl ester carboxylesterase